MITTKEATQIQNPIPLGFRIDELPDDPGTVYDQGRKPLKDIHLREIWIDDLARTLWLAIKSRHITSQYFKREIQDAAASLRRVTPKTPLDLHYRIHRMTGDHWDNRTRDRSDTFCEELFRYVLSALDGGGFKLEWTEPAPRMHWHSRSKTKTPQLCTRLQTDKC